MRNFLSALILSFLLVIPALASGAGYTGAGGGGGGGGTPGGSSGDAQVNSGGSFAGVAPGAPGNVFTSTGTGWASQAPSSGVLGFPARTEPKYMMGYQLNNQNAPTWTAWNTGTAMTAVITGGSQGTAQIARPGGGGNALTVDYTTGAVAANGCYCISTGTFRSRQNNPALLISARCPSSVDVRYWVGWSNAIIHNVAASALNTLHVASFYYETGLGYTNWQAVTCDGANHINIVDTGIPFQTADLHRFTVALGDATGSNDAKFYYDGSLVATITTNLPGNTQNICFSVAVNNTNNAAKDLYVQRFYCEAD